MIPCLLARLIKFCLKLARNCWISNTNLNFWSKHPGVVKNFIRSHYVINLYIKILHTHKHQINSICVKKYRLKFVKKSLFEETYLWHLSVEESILIVQKFIWSHSPCHLDLVKFYNAQKKIVLNYKKSSQCR